MSTKYQSIHFNAKQGAIKYFESKSSKNYVFFKNYFILGTQLSIHNLEQAKISYTWVSNKWYQIVKKLTKPQNFQFFSLSH